MDDKITVKVYQSNYPEWDALYHFTFKVRDIAKEVSGKWYTIMVDETTDLSNTEQYYA